MRLKAIQSIIDNDDILQSDGESAHGPKLPMAHLASKTAILFNADMVRQATVTTNSGFPIARHDSETALGTDC